MMQKLHLNIVSPGKELFNGEVASVTLPGTMGPFSNPPTPAPNVPSSGRGKVIFDTAREHTGLAF